MTEDGMEQKLAVLDHDITLKKTGDNVTIGFDFDGRQYNVNYTPNGWSTTRANPEAFKAELTRGDDPTYFADTAYMALVLERMRTYQNVGIPKDELMSIARELNPVIATAIENKNPRSGLIISSLATVATIGVMALAFSKIMDERFPMNKYRHVTYQVQEDDSLTSICEKKGFVEEELTQCIDHVCNINHDTMMPGKLITPVFGFTEDGRTNCDVIYKGAEIEVPVKD